MFVAEISDFGSRILDWNGKNGRVPRAACRWLPVPPIFGAPNSHSRPPIQNPQSKIRDPAAPHRARRANFHSRHGFYRRGGPDTHVSGCRRHKRPHLYRPTTLSPVLQDNRVFRNPSLRCCLLCCAPGHCVSGPPITVALRTQKKYWQEGYRRKKDSR